MLGITIKERIPKGKNTLNSGTGKNAVHIVNKRWWVAKEIDRTEVTRF